MFEFQKFKVYTKAKEFHMACRALFDQVHLDRVYENQLRRASLSVPLNIAEGSGRLTAKDRRHFFLISRSSIYECIAILDIIKDQKLIDQDQYQNLEATAIELSKILYSMIKKLGGEWK